MPHPLTRQRARRKVSSRPPATDGDEGDRTPDPLLAKQVLSQLSYIPGGTQLYQRSLSARTWIRTRDLSFIRAAL